jgi:hypothetical protein
MLAARVRTPHLITMAAMLIHVAAGTAQAQLPTGAGTAHLIEWDLATLPDAIDGNPGAIAVDTRGEDNNRVWFVTRVAAPDTTLGGQRVYRFDPAPSLMKGDAHWTSWDLRLDTFAGGLKKIRISHDRRFIFVRSATFVQRIDTQKCTASTSPTCERTVWTFVENPIDPTSVSDIAVDDQNHVFTTGISDIFPTGYVQMLTPGSTTVRRWTPDSAPGICPSVSAGGGASFACNSGIDVHPSKPYLVYYAEQGTNSIAELNTSNTSPSATHPNVRRWSLDTFGAAVGETITQPRSLKIDKWGRVWVNTGSGHLISLDPATSRMTRHDVPGGNTNDLFGLAPDDDVVGYTAADTNKVAVLFPKFRTIVVTPAAVVAPFTAFPTVAVREASSMLTGTVPGAPKVVNTTTTKTADGTFVEAMINTNGNDSLSPLGITANHGKAQGTFFYAVGLAAGVDISSGPSIAKRIGFARLPVKEKIQHPRDDDDTDDGYNPALNPKWHNSEPGDQDADGVPDQYDTPTTRDNMTVGNSVSIAALQSAASAVTTTATTLALIASATSSDLTATLAVDIYNAAGTLVASSGPALGTALATLPTPGAGTLTVRIRNLSSRTITVTPTTVVRMPQ